MPALHLPEEAERVDLRLPQPVAQAKARPEQAPHPREVPKLSRKNT
jgi:hypothetical protein